jgi:hypothetical protein
MTRYTAIFLVSVTVVTQVRLKVGGSLSNETTTYSITCIRQPPEALQEIMQLKPESLPYITDLVTDT